ncbi:gamma-tubulin complex component [Encephalitozoon hellem]|uniref:Spindle pole body component n=1 Tax=Encephalitozoon hellem TaxID=27973 RepID=A0ABY8CLF9_ENCHE|nr:gamma-tubulin complex component [Encephalitozoon hellem]
MRELLQNFIHAFFRNQSRSPSPLFLESASRYLRPSRFAGIGDDEIENAIKAKSYKAYLAYRRMKKNSITKMLCYVLAEVADSTPSIMDELNRNVKRGALGIEVSYFTESSLAFIKENAGTHIYSIVFQIYQNACIYKKLKSETFFSSKAHSHFYEIVREELQRYEKSVIEQDEELLSFYTGMYSMYIRIQIVHQLNECFRDNPKKPFEFLRFNFISNHPFYRRVLESSCLHINTCLREFLFTGCFRDETCEFFISRKASIDPWEEFSIDFGLVPYFINNRVAQKILYIGKCSSLLGGYSAEKMVGLDNLLQVQVSTKDQGKVVQSHSLLDEEEESSDKHIDILNPDLEESIDIMLYKINKKVDRVFLRNPSISSQIGGIKNTFLFGRCDFIETLFLYLKDSKDLSRKSFSYILDLAIRNTYGGVDEFTSKLGVYIVDDENKYENFALFCQVDYPASIIVTKESILKLVTIFQFLWKLKRVEHLLLRVSKMEMQKKLKIKVISYKTLLYKISYFVFEEVIARKWKFFSAVDEMPLDGLRLGIERALDEVIGICQIGGCIEALLDSMKNSLMDVGTGSSLFKDSRIQGKLSELIETSRDNFIGTSLYDLHRYA